MITEEEKLIIEELDIPLLSSSKLIECEKIAEGGFGKVTKGLYMGVPVAIKKLKIFDLNLFIRELKILKKIKHPYVPLLIGVNFRNSNSVSIVTELVNGETMDKYIKNKKPSNVLVLLHMIDLASILCYCHGINLIHRDLKPGNIMIDESMDIKLLDFGISKFSEKSHTNTIVMGSLYYMAPECLLTTDEESLRENKDKKLNLSFITKKVDVWAFGLILYTLISMEKLYERFDMDNNRIQSFLYSKKDYPIDKKKISNSIIGVICEQCTKYNPDDRPDMNSIKRQLISALYEEIKSIYVDVNDLIGKVDPKSKFYILSKMENYLNEYLKIAPVLQKKAKNKMEVIYKSDNLYINNKKRVANLIRNNLEIIKEKAISKNHNLNKLKKKFITQSQKEEELRKIKFDIKMNQIAEFSDSVTPSSSEGESYTDSDSDYSSSEDLKISNKLLSTKFTKVVGFNLPGAKVQENDSMYSQIEKMFGIK